MLLVVSPLAAADVSGKWKANLETPMGSMEITFNFQVNGEELKGTVTNPQGGEDPIKEGKVKGDEIAFVVTAGPGGEFTINYKGKLAGDELKLTLAFGDMPPMEMTAKRVN